MKTRKLPLLTLATLAALGLAAARPVQAQTVTYTSGTYFANNLANDGTEGTTFDTLNLSSNSGTATLAAGTPTIIALNGVTFTAGPSSSTAPYGPITYTGAENLTVGGVTKTLTFTYNATSNAASSFDVLNILPATASFDLGSQGTVNVTTQAFQLLSNGVATQNLNAAFAVTPVPEPSSLAVFAVASVGVLSLILKARRRACA